MNFSPRFGPYFAGNGAAIAKKEGANRMEKTKKVSRIFPRSLQGSSPGCPNFKDLKPRYDSGLE